MGKNQIYDGMFRPVNRLAKRVTEPGFQFESIKKIAQRHWDAQPSLRPVPNDAPKLAGIKFGRFIVLGLYNEGNGLWVVRCTCGAFETRKAKSIRNPANKNDCCDNCRQIEYLKTHEQFLLVKKI